MPQKPKSKRTTPRQTKAGRMKERAKALIQKHRVALRRGGIGAAAVLVSMIALHRAAKAYANTMTRKLDDDMTSGRMHHYTERQFTAMYQTQRQIDLARDVQRMLEAPMRSARRLVRQRERATKR